MRLYIGLMSGTSMDGIDAALVDADTQQLLAGLTRPYCTAVAEQLQTLMHSEAGTLAFISQLHTQVGHEFAEAAFELLHKARVSPQQIEAIGSHGQTVCHNTAVDIPYTWQLGCPHTIAEQTGITVVADFRVRDLVRGGQGAPFAPLYHQVLFGEASESATLVVNIGGIANVTYLTQGQVDGGHDVGPGNCLMDAWVGQHLGVSYDAAGAWASTGQVIKPLLMALLDDAYFKRRAPKSVGREYFSLDWLAPHLKREYVPQDVQATLLRLTVMGIVQATEGWTMPERVLLCGGGAHNQALMQQLQQALPASWVGSTHALGVDPDFIEAMMCAWLARQTREQHPVDLTHVTGAQKSGILGAVYFS